MIIQDSNSVYFQPLTSFTASTNGIDALNFVAGVDENGDPLVYIVPRHQAKVWQDRYKWGQIVDIRRVIKNTAMPPIPPTNPADVHEVVVPPGMVDPALKTATTTIAAPVEAAVEQAAIQTAPSDPAAETKPTGAPAKTGKKAGAKKQS